MEVSKVINQLAYKVRERAVHNVSKLLPTTEDLEVLARRLDDSKVLDYQMYKIIGMESPASLRRFFGTSTFLLFPRTDFGEISADDFLSFIHQTIDLEYVTAELTKFSRGSNTAYFDLSESELGAFLYSQMRKNITNKLQFDLIKFYISALCRRFFFTLDNKRSGRISTKRLLQTPLLEEFLKIKRILGERIDENRDEVGHEDKPIALSNSWFDPDNLMDIYFEYVKLDKDKNGTLSIDEMLEFSGTKTFSIQFTRIALERLFEVHVCNEIGELDFNGFVDLVIAIDNPKTRESHNYFWKALNIDTSERITSKTITYFYNEVVVALERLNYNCPKTDDVIVEIFDILACSEDQLGGASFDEIIACGQGDIVLIMLLDVNSFWRYDNREQLMQKS